MEPLFLDVMLGKLATYLRMCGYDAVYAHEEGLEADDAISDRARETGRTLLTRDEDLAARTGEAVLLESRETESQLRELSAAGFRLELPEEPTRCSVCNGPLRAADAGTAPEHAPDDVADVWQCEDCEQYFWKGGHWDRVRETLRDATGK